jgi:pilus assembly protein CpaE
MEAELGESWGDLNFADALVFLRQPDAQALEFIAIAVDDEDDGSLPLIRDLIQTAKAAQIKVILIAEELSPMVLHQLLRLGADDFVPYPCPKARCTRRSPGCAARCPMPAAADAPAMAGHGARRRGAVRRTAWCFRCTGCGRRGRRHHIRGQPCLGTGDDGPQGAASVCLIDLDLQFGSVSTYLDLPRREAIYELLSNTAVMDRDAFLQALLPFNDRLQVLTAPPNMLPLDLIGPDDINRIIDMARANFDYVVIDMPTSIVQWTETVLASGPCVFRHAGARHAFGAERAAHDPGAEGRGSSGGKAALCAQPRAGLHRPLGKARAKRLAESLDIDMELWLARRAEASHPGQRPRPAAGRDRAKNALRKEIQKLARSLARSQPERRGSSSG